MASPACKEMGFPARSLVLVGCSRRKVAAPGLLPAIERYDGPIFRLLRRFLRISTRPISIHILSAAYGLIPADQPIPWYDCQMSTDRATALCPAVDASLREIANAHPFAAAFVCMSAMYREALPEFAAFMPAVPIQIASGTIGRQLGMLHDWLYGQPPTPAQIECNGETARIRGIEVKMTANEAIRIARRALARGAGNPYAFQSWYVPVDDQRVAPKWLVSQLSGLAVSAFTTDEARRVLAHIGVSVRRA
jgi:hypothetical protein